MSRNNKRTTSAPKPISSTPAKAAETTTETPVVVVVDQAAEQVVETTTVPTTETPAVTVVEESVANTPDEVLPPPVQETSAPEHVIPLTQEQRIALQHAATVKDALEQYVRTLEGKAVVSQESLRTAGRLMYRAINFLLKFPETEVLDVFWNFHLQYRDTLMRENSALRGVNYLHKHESDVVTVVYTAFRVKMTNDSNPIDWNRVEELTKSQAIRVYLQSKKTPR